jgi:flagellar basal-body rod protein FlgB
MRAGDDDMPVSEIPILSMLRTRMHWHQERQRVLAENVANADTPNFKPRDLSPPKFEQSAPSATSATLARTHAGHLAGAAAGSSRFGVDGRVTSDTRPAGNAVSLEDQMLKVATNQMDYQAVTALYGRSLGLIKTALGRR